MDSIETRRFDFVIVGSGLAGSAAAYLLSDMGTVALLGKSSIDVCNSFHAQGGIAASVSSTDSASRHAEDTLAVGGGLCNSDVVDKLTKQASRLINWLQDIGVQFDHDDTGKLCLGLEGAHSQNRILHAGGDATGRKIMVALTRALERKPNVTRFTNTFVSGLISGTNNAVTGVLVDDVLPGRVPKRAAFLTNRITILATGGIGQLFSHTTNPMGATGDGIALAYLAGAAVSDLELVQFHPTSLSFTENPHFLISEAVRGAGAKLVTNTGFRLMETHPLQDLAPRDVVTRAVFSAMAEGCIVNLDARSISNFPTRFPTIFETCMNHGLNPAVSLLPITPAAHFLMGGIRARIDGVTNVPGLAAIGEVACTGVHGANRLASNSLLECVVMASELSQYLKGQTTPRRFEPSTTQMRFTPSFLPTSPELLRQIQTVMWRNVGIVRDEIGLRAALSKLRHLQSEFPYSASLCTAILITECALCRKESRGAHFRSDFPYVNQKDVPHHTTLIHGEEPVYQSI